MKKSLALVCEEESSLNPGAVDKGRSEEEESENEVGCALVLNVSQ